MHRTVLGLVPRAFLRLSLYVSRKRSVSHSPLQSLALQLAFLI